VPVAALPADKGWSFLHDCEASGIAGGRIYDALIAAIAIDAGARDLMTFHSSDFAPFSDRLRLTIP
jgi:predicted nucleic acid-binding protein